MDFLMFVKKNLPGFLLVLHFLDYLDSLQKKSGNFEECQKSPFEKITQISLF